MSGINDVSLLDLFREEVRGHAATLSAGLLELEGQGGSGQAVEPLMRAAHSIKGAARIVNIEAAVGLAHAMEDALEAARGGGVRLGAGEIDALLEGADLLGSLADVTEGTVGGWGTARRAEVDRLVGRYQAMARGEVTRAAPPPAERAQPAAPVVSPARTDQTEPGPDPRPEVVIPEESILPGDEAPLFDLFREEVRSQALALRAGLEAVERGERGATEGMAAAAQAIQGAARIVGLGPAAELAGALGGAAAGLRGGEGPVGARETAPLWRAVAHLAGLIGATPEAAAAWGGASAGELEALSGVGRTLAVRPTGGAVVEAALPPAELPAPAEEVAVAEVAAPVKAEGAEAVVRVTAESLTRLMSLAGESLVQARWLQPFSAALLGLKKQQDRLAGLIDALGDAVSGGRRGEPVEGLLEEMRQQAGLCRQVLAERMGEFEDHAAQAEDLNSRLYREVIVSRMRPFADGAVGLPRMVRDMARRLGKQVRLVVEGQGTEVDRDVLERLEAPLTHLIRNAVDHAIEPPDVRQAAGKPAQGTIRLEVRHRAGALAVTVSDDGGGIDTERLRRKVVERGLAGAEMAGGMGEAELLEFLFLPGFSTAREVTEYSGRGVGLDVVQTTIRQIGGNVRVTTRPGAGTTFHLQLPVTLSVVRAVLVEVGGEPYAFPHNRINRLVRVPRGEVRSLEHRQYVTVDGRNVGLVVAAQLLELDAAVPAGDELPVLLLGDESGEYGLVVEAFRGEQDLVVRPLDARLGKVPNISAAAILDDGRPVLIADVEDLIRSMDQYIQAGSLRRFDVGVEKEARRKRVLVVDDSITVREVERQLLRGQGYDVAVAVDGRDGWNQLRAGEFDLVVSDVDMPRMSGLELVKAIRGHGGLQDLPVIIVSYKDREEDRRRGLEVGANYYLTKSSFHDNAFLRAVADLIGGA